MGVDRGREARRGDRLGEGLDGPVSGVPVVGELRRRRPSRPAGSRRRSPRRDVLVEPPLLPGEQLRGDDLGQERVAVAVRRAALVDGQDLAPDRLADCRLELLRRPARDIGKQVVVGEGARDRRDPHHPERIGREPGQAAQQDVPDRRRDAARLPLRGHRRCELLGEERIALGAGVDALQQRRLRRPAEDLGEHLALVGPAQRPELDPGDVRPAGELGEADEERVAVLEVVGPERADQQEAAAAHRPDDEDEEVARCRVAPVEVLEDQHERAIRGEPVHQRQRQLEQAVLVG